VNCKSRAAVVEPAGARAKGAKRLKRAMSLSAYPELFAPLFKYVDRPSLIKVIKLSRPEVRDLAIYVFISRKYFISGCAQLAKLRPFFRDYGGLRVDNFLPGNLDAISHLNLWYVQLFQSPLFRSDDKVHNFRRALESGHSLVSLKMGGCSAFRKTPALSVSFLRTLSTSTTLRKLEIVADTLLADGIRAIAAGLAANTLCLTYLHLRIVDVCDDGAIALASSLKSNTTLDKLVLANNRIGDTSAHAFADALRSNTTLAKLKLYQNNIEFNGLKALSDSLCENTTLEVLNVRHQTGAWADSEWTVAGIDTRNGRLRL
jgi:hypothetical protein